jgi:hypothetical protein
MLFFYGIINITGYATKMCTENGTWFVSPHTNSTYTDFTGCVERNYSLMAVSQIYQYFKSN